MSIKTKGTTMFKRFFAAVVIAGGFMSLPSHAVESQAIFSAGYPSQLSFLFFNKPFGRTQECVIENGRQVVVSVQGKNSGTEIAKGCWELDEHGDARVHISPRYSFSGFIVIKKEKIRKL